MVVDGSHPKGRPRALGRAQTGRKRMTDDPERPAGPTLSPLDTAAQGFDAIAKMNKEFIGNLEGMSQAWLSHAQATASLVNDLVTQLMKARSAPETITAY